MKENNSIYGWGKFDKNDYKHLGLGGFIYALLLLIGWLIVTYTNFDLGLEPKYPALIGTFVVAYIWEYNQHRISKAKIDIKDIFVTCVPGIIVTIFL